MKSLLVWREPKSREEALALLRLFGALQCRGVHLPALTLWLGEQPVGTVMDWLTAYSAASRSRAGCPGAHELQHAFGFLAAAKNNRALAFVIQGVFT